MYLRPVPFHGPASCTIGKWSEEMYGDHIQGPADSYYIRYIVDAMNSDRRSQASPHSKPYATGVPPLVDFALSNRGGCVALITALGEKGDLPHPIALGYAAVGS